MMFRLTAFAFGVMQVVFCSYYFTQYMTNGLSGDLKKAIICWVLAIVGMCVLTDKEGS